MLVVTDLRCWFHKFLKFVVPECGSGLPAQKPARGLRFDHWGAAKVRAPTWRDRPGLNSASRRVDQIHLSLFTADYVPVQDANAAYVVSACRSYRNDYEYFDWPS